VTRHSLRILSAAVFAFALFFAVASPAQTNTYTVSGPAGGTWTVDDNLNVYLGAGITGPVLYTTGNGEAVTRGPFTIQAKEGDQITDQVIDTFGHCTGLTPLYLSCKNSTPVLVDPGLPGVCGRPGGNLGESYRDTYTIPAIAGCGESPIASVEFTQVIQQYQSLSDLKASLMAKNEPPVPIVALKPAVMRIYFTPVTAATNYTVQVAGAANGTKTISLPPGCQPIDGRQQKAGCPSADFYFLPQAGPWVINITVTDSNNNVLEQETLNVTSRTTKTLHLIGSWGCDAQLATSYACGNPNSLINYMDKVTSLMPTSAVVLDMSTNMAYEPLVSSPTKAQYIAWLNSVVGDLNNLYGLVDTLADSSGNSYTVYAGTYRPILGGTGIAKLGGHATLIPEVDMRLGMDATADVEAHETGHTLSLHHTNTDYPQATNHLTPGCYNMALDPTSKFPYSTNQIQSGTGPEFPFDVKSQTVFDPRNTYELMGYCEPRMISPYSYKIALTSLNGGTVASPSGKSFNPGLQAGSRSPLASPAISSLALGSYIQIGGTISSLTGTVVFDPFFIDTILGNSDPGSGSYSIQMLDGSGNVLYTRYFDPTSAETDVESGPDYVGDPTFSEWLPVTAGVVTIAVIDPNANRIGTIPLTSVPIAVTLTAPTAGSSVSTPQLVSWTIANPTASAYDSRILYSSDNGNTWSMIGQLQGSTSLTVDFSSLPGTAASQALIRVLVSDGVNTGSATSQAFTVAKKVPSTILIASPQPGYTQSAADPLELIGYALDPDDGMLHGSSLAWSDSVQGALGSGSPLSVTLQPGPHTITLTGTDSDGNTITATTSVTMAGKGPTLALTTTTLSTNCVSASIVASPGTQGAALSLVQYSLDGGNTYTSVPLNALPYSFVVPGSTGGTLVAVAQDASRQSAAQSTAVSLAGACTAGAPTFFGGSPQIATVGSAFSTPLTVLVSDAYGNPKAGASVNFTAPATGASATITPATATTGANGVATATAKANGTTGNYTVVASVTGFSSTAQFSLTNTDFSLALVNSSLTVHHGYAGFNSVLVTPLSGFNSSVTLGCTGLPQGARCTFSPVTVTPSGSPAYSSLTINVAGAASPNGTAMKAVSGGTLALALSLLLPGLRRRGRRLGIFMLLAFALVLCLANGCGSSFHSFSSSVAVTATSGSLSHTQTITLMVQ